MVPNEVIESMKKTPSLVAHLIAETNNEQLDATDGKNWSTRTILAHLRDAEMYEFTQKGMIGDKEINLLTVVDWWAHHDLSHIEQMEVTLGETVADAQSRQLKKGTLSD